MLDTSRNTFTVQATNNPTTDEMREELAQMSTELGFVLKHVSGGAEKLKTVNYLTKPQTLRDEYYYNEDAYAVNDQMGGFRTNSQGSKQRELAPRSRKPNSKQW